MTPPQPPPGRRFGLARIQKGKTLMPKSSRTTFHLTPLERDLVHRALGKMMVGIQPGDYEERYLGDIRFICELFAGKKEEQKKEGARWT